MAALLAHQRAAVPQLIVSTPAPPRGAAQSPSAALNSANVLGAPPCPPAIRSTWS